MLKLLCKEYQAVGSTFRIMMMPLTAVSGQSMAYNIIDSNFALKWLRVILEALNSCKNC